MNSDTYCGIPADVNDHALIDSPILSRCRANQLRVLDMQNQIHFGLALGAARSTLARRQDLRGIVERQQSTAESNQVINIIIFILE